MDRVDCPDCGRRYDTGRWNALPLAGYTFQYGRDRELRMCHCGRMLVGREADGRPRTPVVRDKRSSRAR